MLKKSSIPFDENFYLSQVSSTAGRPALEHYLSEGSAQGLDPTPFFNHKWYAWQNPDWSRDFDNPYLHYLEVGRGQLRDPSPMIDMRRYQQTLGANVPVGQYYERILKGKRSAAFGVYESWDDLKHCQEIFLSSINVIAHRLAPLWNKRPYLVFLQAGPQSIHRQWFREEGRTWDLLVNYYDPEGFDRELGDFVFFQPGSKFTGVAKLWENFPEVLRGYRQILFLDDDILVTVEDLNRLFDICREGRLDLAQMSLSPDSHCVWKDLFNKGNGIRHLNTVEIMMPVLSERAMEIMGGQFRRSISGFGLDLLCGKRVALPDYSNVAVLDSIQAHHLKPIDDSSGAYYDYMRSRMINPKAELWNIVQTENVECEIRQVD